MCEIVGVISLNGTEEYKYFIKKALKNINPKGVDDKNIYQDENICFGYTKMTISDLDESYNQPLITKDTISFANAEVYKIKQKSLSKNQLDIETLIKNMILKKEQIYEYIDADFALCTYDKKNKIVYLARDFFGVKPLYYYWIDSVTLAFASEINALNIIINKSLTFNVETITDYLVFGYPLKNKTFYLNIHSLPPKTIFMWDLKKNLQKSFSATNDYLKYTNKKSNIYNAINIAVKDRLISDRKIGAHLSGGYDSSLVAYIARNKLEYFTAYNNLDDQDLYISNIISDELKLNHYIIKLPEKYEYENLISVLSSPIMSTGAFVPYEIAKNAASYNQKVLLEGQGADELFLGYKRFSNIKNIKTNDELIEILSNSNFEMLNKLFYGVNFKEKYKFLYNDNNFLSNAQKFYIDNFLAEILHIEHAVHMKFNIKNLVPYLSLPIRKFIKNNGINFESPNKKEALFNAHNHINSKALLKKEKTNMNRSLLEELKKVDLKEILKDKIFENFDYQLLEKYLEKIESLSEKELFVIWTLYNINLWYKMNKFKIKIKV